MDNVQNCDSFINMPPSQTCENSIKCAVSSVGITTGRENSEFFRYLFED
jgi:hypothetical protein